MKRIQPFRTLLLLFTTVLVISGCEIDVTVDLPPLEDRIVVEGTIEPGQPPFLTLTRNAAFFGTFDLNSLDAFFVRDAVVTVSDGLQTVNLIELCLQDLPPEYQAIAADLFGIDEETLSEIEEDYCVYTVDLLSGSFMLGVVGRTYTLQVRTSEDSLTAVTTIPGLVPIDSMWFSDHPDPENDTLVNLNFQFTDPDTLGNYYRYFTKQNSEPYYPGFNSVFDDLFVNGEQFDFILDRGQPRTAGFDPDTYGDFLRGDTVIVKWSTIDLDHYEFWNTLEFDSQNSGNPFGGATNIASNVEGGLGVFGGYGAAYDTLIIPAE